ncbi:hypothetical protein A9Q02_22800 [Candidatus Chloroploca asiatica]|uniref:Uncharacterized protein n=2 Tax=Candidatus Chloroploca TaxID=1579476 RepID=A0A2H3KRV4_9CHLR|nr:hypothetical protein A9Q02_22800 [Candidatus Chloroploca asiatica]
MTTRMDKRHFSIVSLSEESGDQAYWQQQHPLDRIAALELMRQVMYGYDITTARLQSVLTIAERPSS